MENGAIWIPTNLGMFISDNSIRNFEYTKISDREKCDPFMIQNFIFGSNIR